MSDPIKVCASSRSPARRHAMKPNGQPLCGARCRFNFVTIEADGSSTIKPAKFVEQPAGTQVTCADCKELLSRPKNAWEVIR